MSLYTIGDLHLSLGTNKPMDVFGGRWENYVQKLSEGFRSSMTMISQFYAEILPGE